MLSFLILSMLACLSVALSLAVFAYHAFLAIVAFVPLRKARARACNGSDHRFAVVVPAHNEEHTLHIALDSLRELDYPQDKFDVYVVADNCDDGTAAVAEGFGVQVLVRQDEANRGKGHALTFAFDRVLDTGCDAIVVLDADCRIHPNTLKAADSHLRHGEWVLQCNNRVGNREHSPTTLVLAAANALENDFFYAPKSRLGLFVLLRGTGMILHRAILERIPWNAGSVIEDAEYSYRLAGAGINVRFLPEVDVVSDLPVSRNQLTVQRERWFGGGLHVALRLSPKMFLAGLCRRSMLLLDAAVSSWIIMRPFVVVQLGLSLVLATTLWSVQPGGLVPRLLLGTSLVICAGFVLYAVLGLMRFGMTSSNLKLLARVPFVVLLYLWISARTALRGTPKQWHRTPRESTTPQ